MSRLATSFVLGFHGCDKAVADQAINGNMALVRSDRAYDWLGPGAYFWESDPDRAQEWADWKVSIGQYKNAAVVGAVIDLRNCLDLVSRKDVEMVAAAHASFVDLQQTAGLPIPENKGVRSQLDQDRVLRYLDCAVIKHLHNIIDDQPVDNRVIHPFDTVRGMFTEGGELYPGCGFQRRSHVQIAVRNDACIKGFFLPR